MSAILINPIPVLENADMTIIKASPKLISKRDIIEDRIGIFAK